MAPADPVVGATREHLFISYATEDAALAEWLTRKLTAEGYRIWCDRFKLLGGESYPSDIDLAIKSRTFRVLAILSRESALAGSSIAIPPGASATSTRQRA